MVKRLLWSFLYGKNLSEGDRTALIQGLRDTNAELHVTLAALRMTEADLTRRIRANEDVINWILNARHARETSGERS